MMGSLACNRRHTYGLNLYVLLSQAHTTYLRSLRNLKNGNRKIAARDFRQALTTVHTLGCTIIAFLHAYQSSA